MISIISNNCWGSGYYAETLQPYATPTVGLWFYPEDYLRMLKDLRQVLRRPLAISRISKRRGTSDYPVGHLGDDIEIQFMHYKDDEEAIRKWNARMARLAASDDDILVKLCDREGLTDLHLQEFDAIPFHRKIAFVKKGRFEVSTYSWAVELETEAKTVGDGLLLWDQTKKHPLLRSVAAPWFDRLM